MFSLPISPNVKELKDLENYLSLGLLILFLALCAIAVLIRLHRRYFVQELPITSSAPSSRYTMATPKKGLTHSEITKLPSFDFKTKDLTDTYTCLICLCGLTILQSCRICPRCKRWYHIRCFDRWYC
ncbi:hypothetical protein ACFE04_014683 [Oxalis oulophora]